MERIYGGHLCYGPPIENGFYYDMFSKDYTVSNPYTSWPNETFSVQDFSKVSDGDFPVIEDLMKKIVKEKQPFERLVMKKSDLLQMFDYNEVGHQQKKSC